MTTLRVIAGAVLVCLSASHVGSAGLTMQAKPSSSAKPTAAAKKIPAQEVDGLLAPVALYPDQLLAQMLLSATTPARVTDLDTWLKTNPPFKGTALQDAAKQTGFEPSLVMLVLFPQVVDFMATNLDWTTAVGQAFTGDRAAVMESVQRLRADAMKAGKLKSSPQQSVSIMKTESGQEVIVIEPVNPQVVYVPQYSTQAVYTQAPTSTTVVIKEESNDSAAMAAGIIGFTAGIAIGAAMDNDYYYGPYGWHGGPHMYNDDWDDFYDDRQDAREDWYEDREDVREDVRDNREDALESRSDRASSSQQQADTEAPADPVDDADVARGRRTGHRGNAEDEQHQRVELRGPRPEPRPVEHRSRAERHQIGRVFQLLQRQVGALGQRAWAKQPLVEWRPEPAMTGRLASMAVVLIAGMAIASCAPARPQERRFGTPEEAVTALIDTAEAGNLDELLTLFGPGGQELVSSSDPATGRRNREVFEAAAAEQWRLADLRPDAKELIVGSEDWPFPIPLVKDANGWRFDTAAGKEEVLARRIGRNELAVIDICRAYVAAQRAFAKGGHDGKPAGLYARKFNSDAGTENGLYWPAKRGGPRSPLGDLVAAAAEDGYGLAARQEPAPFHGYHFRILTAQGPAAAGGAMDYVRNGEMSGGFALVAWPAQYDATGIMTFIVNGEGIVFEKDLGPDTPASARAVTRYDPDGTWRKVQADAGGKP